MSRRRRTESDPKMHRGLIGINGVWRTSADIRTMPDATASSAECWWSTYLVC
jgi:hypothetical protein